MKKNILSLAILSSLSISTYAQEIPYFPISNIEVTAVVDAGCDLTADNINFGVLAMPLTDSTAQANMNVKCSKGANLEIAINYSENASGSSSDLSNYRLEYNAAYGADGDYIQIYDANDNTQLGVIYCHRNPTGAGWAGISTAESQAGFLNSIGVPNTQSGWGSDTNGVCVETTEGFRVNRGFFTGGSIGALTGLTSGEQIKYSLELPSDSSKSWNSSSKHSVLATGNNQVIPMKANIKRADNGDHRYTPDTYQSVLTVVLNY